MTLAEAGTCSWRKSGVIEEAGGGLPETRLPFVPET